MEKIHQNLTEFVERIEGMNSEQFSSLVNQYLDDDAIEIMASHVAEFYDLEDDDEIGGLTQIMVTGYLAAKNAEAN